MGDAKSAFSGGLTGAAIGSGVAPGVGTALGGLAGLTIGGFTDLFGGGDDEKKAMRALQQRQKELAAELERQRQETYKGRIQALNQSTQALAPYNNMVAQMVGPQAAFSGDQVAAMTADPKGGPSAQYPWIQNAFKAGWDQKPLLEFAELMGQTAIVDGKRQIPREALQKVQHDYDTLKEYARQRREYNATTQRQGQALNAAFAPSAIPQGPTTQAAAAPTAWRR